MESDRLEAPAQVLGRGRGPAVEEAETDLPRRPGPRTLRRKVKVRTF